MVKLCVELTGVNNVYNLQFPISYQKVRVRQVYLNSSGMGYINGKLLFTVNNKRYVEGEPAIFFSPPPSLRSGMRFNGGKGCSHRFLGRIHVLVMRYAFTKGSERCIATIPTFCHLCYKIAGKRGSVTGLVILKLTRLHRASSTSFLDPFTWSWGRFKELVRQKLDPKGDICLPNGWRNSWAPKLHITQGKVSIVFYSIF